MGLLSYADGAGKVQVAGPGAPMPVGSGDPSFLTASIPNGTAITPAIDLGSQRLHRIVIPAAWTAAAISFDVSYDGTNFAPLFNSAGEFSLASATVVAASRSVLVDLPTFYGIRYLKVRSGLVASPVNQAAQRDLILVTVAR